MNRKCCRCGRGASIDFSGRRTDIWYCKAHAKARLHELAEEVQDAKDELLHIQSQYKRMAHLLGLWEEE